MPKQSSNVVKYLAGNWNVRCDTCDRIRKRTECKLSYYDGDIPCFVTCIDGCSDERHPLNSPPPVIWDGRPVPDPRPDVVLADATFVPLGSSQYRWGINWPGPTWNTTNDDSPFSTSVTQLWGQFT